MLPIMSSMEISSSVCPLDWQWKIGAAVTVSLATMAAQRYWCNRKLNRKLENKREQCRKSLRQIEQELEERNMSTTDRDAILSLPLAGLQGKLQSGELRVEDVLRAYQHKALELNARINCVVESVPEAQEQAASCDRSGDRTRLLHGVPLSLKENLSLQGYDTTAGMQINVGVPCEEDAVVVKVFKRHGAIPFVRTNIPQAMLSYTCSNPIFGVTLNPHNTDHCPGGSSGGEGAILGGGASIIGLGTDVGGSVRIPAAFCGACALKPTLGRFSKIGSYSVNKGKTIVSGVVGPMARDVDSLVVMTRVMASPDMWELDPALPPLPFQEQLLTSSHKLRIGYYTWDGNLHPVPVVCRAVREAKAALEALGHTVVEFHPPDYAEVYGDLYVGTMIGADQGRTLGTAVKDDYKDVGIRIASLSSLPRWLISLLAKIVQIKEPVLSRAMLHMKKEGSAFSWFQQAAEILNYRRRFVKEWKRLELDAVICPVFPCPAPKTAHVGFLTTAGSGSCLYNLVNFPAGALPVTKVTPQDVADVNNPKLYQAKTRLETFLKNSCDTEQSVGLPVAVQCVTLPFKEELCLRLMRELETALGYSSL
ncbi:fatty-acid amide hydrolase 1-like [Babylonia areolata]|uniref:fatty-acid amide hydrolase 1-like n=1 Tax=Babylonia areolata TaxID=304850 RepID=UPI003FD000C7